ncbi:TPA: TraR/DksA C4-type zinc finger protein [Klebsiella quasipneumoniae subsp. quasipneumoniae]|nr:TraR/DksA C4-type zinc finger protein [Klebsiella quasipneumoniae subsp. quasipneumoniae]
MNRYSLIYADPAWSYGNTISNGAAVDHYPTMSLLDMKRLPVWELAADNAVLAMWYTGTHNQEAIELAERRLEMTIQNMRINHAAVSATHCRDCGEEIPERRRELVAGCQRCADCQEEEELRGKHRRGYK